MFFRTASLLLFFTLIGCNQFDSQFSVRLYQPIVNGDPVDPNSQLARSTLKLTVAGETCTGVLIAEDIVLTASHCLKTELIKAWVAPQDYLEVVKINCAAQPKDLLQKVAQIVDYVSPQESDNLGLHDICALKLSKRVPLPYEPLRILDSLPPLGADIVHVGWGFEKLDSNEPVFRSGTSRYQQATMRTIESTQSRDGSKLCLGDSGGPGLVKINNEYFLFGILSFVFGGANCLEATHVQMKRAAGYKNLWKNF